ncbi:formylglycine-generating enzyme family protein [Myxococcota bacterium]|nr:formylglycine-generating enzyme family protein [Myxococcota bacterium]
MKSWNLAVVLALVQCALLASAPALGAPGAVPPDLKPALRTGARATKDAAVVVGIRRHAFLGQVQGADADAEAFSELLIRTRGVPRKRVRRIPGESASARAIWNGVTEQAARTGRGGTFWFYFSGHGALGAEGRPLLRGVTAGERSATEDDGDLSLDRLRDALAELARQRGIRVIMVLDADWNGTDREGSRVIVPAVPEAPAAPGPHDVWLLPVTHGSSQTGAIASTEHPLPPTGQPAEAPGVAVWTGSAAGQGAWNLPLSGAPHGVFTWLVLGALRGWADGEGGGERDGTVTAGEASAYVARTLPTLVRGGQAPTFSGPLDLPLVRARPVRLDRPPPLPTASDLPWDAVAVRARARDVARAEAIARARAEQDEIAADRRARVAQMAAEDWDRVQEWAAQGTDEGAIAAARFVARYGNARTFLPPVPVEVEDDRYTLEGRTDDFDVPQVAWMRAQFPTLPEAPEGAGGDVPAVSLRLGLALRPLPAGTYRIGSPGGEPDRGEEEGFQDVRLDAPVLVGTTEVTAGVWAALMPENPLDCAGRCSPAHPLGQVGYLDAVAFCNRLSALEGREPAYRVVPAPWLFKVRPDADGYRLPYEVEWEVAARSGSPARFAGSDDPAGACGYANVSDASRGGATSHDFPCDDGAPRATRVAMYRPNRWGFYDMTGNLAEWVEGVYVEQPTADEVVGGVVLQILFGGSFGLGNARIDPTVRIHRGGSWADGTQSARIAARRTAVMDRPTVHHGFRIARPAQGP